MASGRPIEFGPLALLFFFVCLAAAAVAWLCGGIAVELYENGSEDDVIGTLVFVGHWCGAGTGVVAGIIWCVSMIWIGLRAGAKHLAAIGMLLGMAVGVLSTLILHIALAHAAGRGGIGEFGVGVLFGLPAGLVLGGISGLLCRLAVQAALKGGNASPATSHLPVPLGKDVADR